MRSRGQGLFREEWYSICSAHGEHNENCNMCDAGHWRNVWITKFGSFMFRHFPKVWIWWANLKFNKRKWIGGFESNKTGEKKNPFPNLKV